MTRHSLSNFLIDDFIISALKEDINGEDVSTNSIVALEDLGQVNLICKEDGILAGINVFKRVFQLIDEGVSFNIKKGDGEKIQKGENIAIIYGPMKTLLSAERVALNFLQRMSGIATYTNKMVEKLDDPTTKIVDTRKTTPNFRLFEKYSVKVGGGGSHRYNLSDGVMLKDNHIGAAGSIKKSCRTCQRLCSLCKKN